MKYLKSVARLVLGVFSPTPGSHHRISAEVPALVRGANIYPMQKGWLACPIHRGVSGLATCGMPAEWLPAGNERVRLGTKIIELMSLSKDGLDDAELDSQREQIPNIAGARDWDGLERRCRSIVLVRSLQLDEVLLTLMSPYEAGGHIAQSSEPMRVPMVPDAVGRAIVTLLGSVTG